MENFWLSLRAVLLKNVTGTVFLLRWFIWLITKYKPHKTVVVCGGTMALSWWVFNESFIVTVIATTSRNNRHMWANPVFCLQKLHGSSLLFFCVSEWWLQLKCLWSQERHIQCPRILSQVPSSHVTAFRSVTSYADQIFSSNKKQIIIYLNTELRLQQI